MHFRSPKPQPTAAPTPIGRLILAVLLAFAAPSDVRADARIVNGVNTHAYPTTGQLLYSSGGAINEDNAGSWCSGTLIGCRTFLTAAHCVVADTTAANYWVYLQHAGIQSVSSIAYHPTYTSPTFPIADVAVVTLSADVTGIEPQPINLLENPADGGFGRAGEIVGFGRSGPNGGNSDYGIKRAGAVETASCSGTPQGTTNAELVCWDFTTPLGPAGDDSNTCNGDSGGPLFMDLGAGVVVAGITSGGENSTCATTDHSYDANVYTYRNFILSELGADSTSACGGIPAVGVGQVTVQGNDGELGSGQTTATFNVSMPSGINEARFALNGESNGTFDVQMYVKEGPGAATNDFDCKFDGAGTFGDCIFSAPTQGTWSVLVRRAAGAGEWQVTTTMFGGDPPDCGNDTREFGEECDGTDDTDCPGLCELGCTCPAPACGNDVVEVGEQCDGTSDGACPGECIADGEADECTCNTCGNGVCDVGEDDQTCAEDCGCSADPVCSIEAPAGCFCDSLCISSGDCCADACLTCGQCVVECGNGVVEAGEQCDDMNASGGDGCSASCQTEPCHECSGEPSSCGPVVDGTPCDDGAFCNGDDQCSAGACTTHAGDPCAGGGECQSGCDETNDDCFDAAGTPCTDDADACTDDECDGAGSCVHPFPAACNDGDLCTQDSCDQVLGCINEATPLEGCVTAARVQIAVKYGATSASDQVSWKLTKADAFGQADLGDPSSTTSHALCIYDHSGDEPSLTASLQAGPGPLWRDRDPRGWKYKDGDGAADGLRKIQFKPGEATRSKVVLQAKGSAVPMPAPVSGSRFFDLDSKLTVQLVTDDAACFTSEFTSPAKNSGAQFKAKGP